MAKRKIDDRFPVALFSADIHLQDGAWARREDLHGDAYFAFEWLIDKAIELNVTLCLAGDIVDRTLNKANLVRRANQAIEKAEQGSVPIWYIEGQHGRHTAEPGSSWFSAMHSWPYHIHQVPCTFGGMLNVYGIDWAPRDQLPALLAQVPADTDVLLMHQVCEGLMGSIVTPELTPDMVPHAKLLVIGDYHVTKEFDTIGASGQALHVISPGSTCMQAINEPSDKYAFVLYSDMSLERIAIPSRTLLVPPPILEPENLEFFVEHVGQQITQAIEKAQEAGLPPELQKPLLWLEFSPDIPRAHTRIVNAVADRAALFTKLLVTETETVTAEEVRQPDHELSLLSLLHEEIEDTDSPEYAMAERLLRSSNPALTLAEMRKEAEL